MRPWASREALPARSTVSEVKVTEPTIQPNFRPEYNNGSLGYSFHDGGGQPSGPNVLAVGNTRSDAPESLIFMMFDEPSLIGNVSRLPTKKVLPVVGDCGWHDVPLDEGDVGDSADTSTAIIASSSPWFGSIAYKTPLAATLLYPVPSGSKSSGSGLAVGCAALRSATRVQLPS